MARSRPAFTNAAVGRGWTSPPSAAEDVLGAVGSEPVVDGGLVSQVELVSPDDEEIHEALSLQLS